MKKLIVTALLTLGIVLGFSVASYADSGSAVMALDAGIADASVAVGTGAGTGSALAAPTPLPDPIDNPGAALTAAKSDVATYGYVWGGAVVLLGILVAFKKRNDTNHWIANKYAAAALTAGPAIIAALLTWKFGGGSSDGLIATLLAAAALLYPTGAKAAS